MPLQTGQLLNNRYRIVKLLGQGGFGAVYRSWDANLNRPCAVKENLDVSPEAQRQFTREATILANLTHPNLPRVTDHFILPGQGQYLVMDFVEGEDLASIIRQRGKVPVDNAVAWISQVADALDYLHNRQPPVFHRDIKPANIRITPDDKAMLVDFGLVKVYDPRMRTTLGARAVTPGYAPPEQYGQASTDARSDIYALGATLYNILTGQEPMESVQRMAGGQMPPTIRLNPEVSIEVSQSIEQSLQLQPTHRYQNVRDFKTALQSALKADHNIWIEQSTAPPAAIQANRSDQSPALQKTDSKPPVKKKRRLLIVIGLVLMICVLTGLGLLSWMTSVLQDNVQKTAEAQTEATLEERVRTTSTAQAVVTSTARSISTQQALMSYLQANAQTIFGPTSGALNHEEGESIIADDAEVNLRDFMLEASFLNPYSAVDGDWDYGFIVRHDAKNSQFRFVVRSTKEWILLNNNGDPDGVIINKGDLPELQTAQGENNRIKLIFQGNRGWFYLNEKLITQLDLSARMNSGDIFIATGIYDVSRIPGMQTGYQNFSIWSLP